MQYFHKLSERQAAHCFATLGAAVLEDGSCRYPHVEHFAWSHVRPEWFTWGGWQFINAFERLHDC